MGPPAARLFLTAKVAENTFLIRLSLGGVKDRPASGVHPLVLVDPQVKYKPRGYSTDGPADWADPGAPRTTRPTRIILI